MSKKFKTIDLTKKELEELWSRDAERARKLQRDNIRLKNHLKYWQAEAEKYERLLSDMKTRYIV